MVSILFLFMTNLTTAYEHDEKEMQKIVNGRDARSGEYPFAANILLRSDFTQVCTGSIISKIFILTACHCVGRLDNKGFSPFEVASIIIAVGHIDRKPRNPRDGQVIRYADMSFVHPNCEFVEYAYIINDIGVFRLTYPLQWTKFVQPLPVLTRSKKKYKEITKNAVYLKTNCVSLGWGLTAIEGIHSYSKPANLLQALNFNMISYEECRKDILARLFDVENEGIICALAPPASNVCCGDSGSPLLCNGSIYGILSFGTSCGECYTPTMYTRLDHVFDFYNMFLTDF